MLQSKEWQNGYKTKTHIYAAYKGITSDLKTHIDKVRGWKNVFQANGNKKKTRATIRQNRFKNKTVQDTKKDIT